MVSLLPIPLLLGIDDDLLGSLEALPLSDCVDEVFAVVVLVVQLLPELLLLLNSSRYIEGVLVDDAPGFELQLGRHPPAAGLEDLLVETERLLDWQ